MSFIHAYTSDAGLVAVGMIVLTSCTSEPREFYLPERSVPPDIAALPADFDVTGGPVLIRLTEWANAAVLGQLEAAGLQPVPGYARVERLDTLGMNITGGTIVPEGLERILSLMYVVRVEPAPAAPHRSAGKRDRRRRRANYRRGGSGSCLTP
jgi:hypothetical protein